MSVLLRKVKNGEQGEKGDDGKDAFELHVSPDPLTFGTKDSGTVDLTSGDGYNHNGIVVTATCGDEVAQITKCTLVSVSNTTFHTPTFGDDKKSLTYYVTGVTTKSTEVKMTDDTTKTRFIPATSGSVTLLLTLLCGTRTAERTVTLSFRVNIDNTLVQMYTTENSVVNKVTEVKSVIEGVTERVGKVETTAERVSLSVSSKYAVGANLLAKARVRQLVTTNTTPMGVALTKGKTYTLSARCKVNQTLLDKSLRLEVDAYYDADTSDSKWDDLCRLRFTETAWTVVSDSFEAKYTGVYYVYAVVCDASDLASSAASAVGSVDWLCLEEGSESTAPSAHEGDLDNNASIVGEWTCGGTEETDSRADGTAGTVYHGTAASGSWLNVATAASSVAVAARKTYTLSFWAKGSGQIASYLYPSACIGSMDGQGATVENKSDGGFTNTLTERYTKYQVTFTPLDSIGSAGAAKSLVAVRAMGGAEVWCYGFKLEEGGVATDGSLDNRLLDTGVDVTNRMIVATADNFEVRNNKGETTMAVDAEGRLQCGSLLASDGSGAYVSVEFHDGKPSLVGRDSDGNVVWSFNGEATYNGGNAFELVSVSGKFQVWHNSGWTQMRIEYTADVVIRNTSIQTSTFDGKLIGVAMGRYPSGGTATVTLGCVQTTGAIDNEAEGTVKMKATETYVATSGAFASIAKGDTVAGTCKCSNLDGDTNSFTAACSWVGLFGTLPLETT